VVGGGEEELVGVGVVDGGGRWLAVVLEADRDAPVRDAGEEVERAVDAVDDPAAGGRAGSAGAFLAEERVVRALGFEEGDDRPLGGGVGFADEVGGRQLGLDVEPSMRCDLERGPRAGADGARGEVEVRRHLSRWPRT
jgi:hypothetical protein